MATPATIRLGSRGENVKTAQKLLGRVTVDGIYGPKTKAAVVAYQIAAGLAADGVVGPKTWAALLGETQAATTGTPFGQPDDFKQGGSPWGPKMYSATGNKSQTYANSGCGPTAMADIVASMKDETVTPETLGKLAVANGYRTASNGTAWGFFKFIADRYGFSKFAQTLSRATLRAALAAGALVVCSMAPGYWTKGGHFICVWKDDGTYIYANDPASRVRKLQEAGQFMRECKQIFIFWP